MEGSALGRAWDIQDLLEGTPRASLRSRSATGDDRLEPLLPTLTAMTPDRAASLTPAGYSRPTATASGLQQQRAGVLGGVSTARRSDGRGGNDGNNDALLPAVDDGYLAMKDPVLAGLLRAVGGVGGMPGHELEGPSGAVGMWEEGTRAEQSSQSQLHVSSRLPVQFRVSTPGLLTYLPAGLCLLLAE